MKTTYVFHLGRESELSTAELKSFFGNGIEQHGSIALLSHEPFDDPKTILNQLGGTMKISEPIDCTLEEALERAKPEGKISFGLNLYPQNELVLKKSLMKVKQGLKTRKRNGRFLNKKTNLPTSTIVKGGLLEEGTDLNIVQLPDKQLFTRTIAVQDFIAYSLRDYEKPARLAKEGMLPPKLAQMMINLTALVTGKTDFEGKTLYDPFCGSGTVLGEGLIKRMNVIGSDLDPKAIKAAEKNIAWLQKKGLAEKDAMHKVFEKDAQTISKEDFPITVHMVVSETYLGPPCHNRMPAEAIKQIQTDLMPLYEQTYRGLHDLLAIGTPIVMAFPIHYYNGHDMPLHGLTELIEGIGFRQHASFTYHRKEQAVGRQILVLERK